MSPAAVWRDTVVSDGAIKVCMAEIRRVLGDAARTPQFIKTEHRRGYRFIATVTDGPSAAASYQSPMSSAPSLKPLTWALPTSTVGRQAKLAQLHEWFEKALGGRRQVVFITGDAGIGKTTLVDLFVERVAAQTACWWARGQCVDHHGAGEAYLPVLEAVGQLCRGPAHGRVLELLHQRAPTWLVQMPWLLSAAELEDIQRQVQGASRERMLREIAAMLEALTAETPMVLVLEDLHWSDYATLDLIAWLAQRRQAARLMLIGTFRPVEMIVLDHPLRGVTQELLMHRQCEQLLLDFLSETAVAQYLGVRFTGAAPPTACFQELAGAVHRRTDGHPLFMVTVADYAIQQGWLVETDGGWDVQAGAADIADGVPESLRQMIEQQLVQLSAEEQQVLDAASVVGVDFSAAAVAAGLGVEVETVEEHCQALTQRGQFLHSGGVEEWPDGTAAERYRFCHALQQQVVYERLPVGRRIRLHQRVGERQEEGYRERARERAAELAEQLLALAQRLQDNDLLLQAHSAIGNTLYYRGELLPAHSQLKRGMVLYHPQQHRSYILRYGWDPGLACWRNMAWTLWVLGYPDQALHESQGVLTVAQESMHPPTLVAALVFGARVHQHRREGRLTQQLTEAAMTLSRQQGFTQRLAAATILHGWALAAQGHVTEGVAEMRRGLDAYQATGADDDRPYWLALLAEGYGQGGQLSAGLQALAEALAVAQTHGLRVWEAELYRLEGELLLQSAAPTRVLQSPVKGPSSHAKGAAETALHQALDVACHQSAKTLELRAAVSLSRLWQQYGKQDEAHELLAGIYDWFTEGFDTLDLREARLLLEVV